MSFRVIRELTDRDFKRLDYAAARFAHRHGIGFECDGCTTDPIWRQVDQSVRWHYMSNRVKRSWIFVVARSLDVKPRMGLSVRGSLLCEYRTFQPRGSV
jgi:hypothetical protein